LFFFFTRVKTIVLRLNLSGSIGRADSGKEDFHFTVAAAHLTVCSYNHQGSLRRVDAGGDTRNVSREVNDSEQS